LNPSPRNSPGEKGSKVVWSLHKSKFLAMANLRTRDYKKKVYNAF